MKGFELHYTRPNKAREYVYVSKAPNMLIFMRHFKRQTAAATIKRVRCTDMMQ